jgi:hypothetical protein
MISALLAPASGAIFGTIGGWVNTYLHNQQQFKLSLYAQNEKAVQAVRGTKNMAFWFAMAPVLWVIAIYFFIVPAVIAFYNIPIHLSFEESHGTITSFFKGDSDTLWKTFVSGYFQSPAQIFSLDMAVAFCFCRPRG